MHVMQNALTVDVEDYFQVAAFGDRISPADWKNYELRVEDNTLRLLDLFDRNNTRATFFTLGWIAEQTPDLVREIARRGHEIASHGYSHQLIYKQSRKLFYDETKRSKEILEDIVNKRVLGYRAASYSITSESLWALDVLVELGFVYDSSIVPVHHDLYGIPGMPRIPHIITAPEGGTLTEFPPTTLSLPGINLPVGGGGYFRLYPYWFSRMALRWVNSHDKIPFIFYLHPWEIDPHQPRLEGRWTSRFRHYNSLSRCHDRLEKLLHDFTFTTVSNVLIDHNLIEKISPEDGAAIVAP